MSTKYSSLFLIDITLRKILSREKRRLRHDKVLSLSAALIGEEEPLFTRLNKKGALRDISLRKSYRASIKNHDVRATDFLFF